MRTMTLIDKKIVALVEARAGDYCEVCGRSATESMALHHRKLKSRGGKDSAANLIRVHHECHNLSTDSIHSKVENAEQKGWICPSWREPQDHPFVRPDGSIVLLLDDGSALTLWEG